MAPKPIFPPQTKAGGDEPRPLTFSAPSPPVEQPRTMPEPSALKFGTAAPATPKVPEPSALKFGTAAPSTPKMGEPRAPQRPEGDNESSTLSEARRSREGEKIDRINAMLTIQEIGKAPRPLQMPPAPPVRQDRILGGDPRAPAVIAKARATDPSLSDHRLFRGRVEAFLDLKPLAWMSWGEQSIKPLTEAAGTTAAITSRMSLAQAPKWGDETRSAYQKGRVGMFDKKPAFYEQMLTNARDILMQAAHDLGEVKQMMADRLEYLRLDTLVFQVATDGVTDPNEIQIASGRLRTLLTCLQNAAALQSTVAQSELMVTKQIGDVQQLLSGILPAWIMAQSKA
jgi:hypothetical protein